MEVYISKEMAAYLNTEHGIRANLSFQFHTSNKGGILMHIWNLADDSLGIMYNCIANTQDELVPELLLLRGNLEAQLELLKQ